MDPREVLRNSSPTRLSQTCAVHTCCSHLLFCIALCETMVWSSQDCKISGTDAIPFVRSYLYVEFGLGAAYV
jgi:hypothetical protein